MFRGDQEQQQLIYLFQTSTVSAITHFHRIRGEGGSGRPPTVHLRMDDITWTYYTTF